VIPFLYALGPDQSAGTPDQSPAIGKCNVFIEKRKSCQAEMARRERKVRARRLVSSSIGLPQIGAEA
jgi:hypothetical protein